MDHSVAVLLDFTDDTIVKRNIESEIIIPDGEFTLTLNENSLQNKQQQRNLNYYKKVGDAIRNYNEVLLFGPTDAKNELFNLIKNDNHFEDIKIKVKNADKMTENQMNAFVRVHFEAK